MLINLDEILKIVGKLYIDNTMLQNENAALHTRIAELEKPQQESDEREKQDES